MAEPDVQKICDQCCSSVRPSHKDDTNTQFYKCDNGHITSHPKARSSCLPADTSPNREEIPKQLEHISNIEEPSLTKKPIIVDAVISSTSVSYTVPSEVRATLKEEDQENAIICPLIPINDPLNLSLVSVSAETMDNRLNKFLKSYGWEKSGNQSKIYDKEILKHRTIYMVRVRPPVLTLEKRDGKCVDDKGYEYKSLDLYIASDKEIVFQPSTTIRIEGLPLPHPKTQKTTLLAYKVEFPEDEKNFDSQKLSSLRGKFEGKSVGERLNWILENFEAYSHVYGRRNIAQAIFLGYFTPLWVWFDGEEQRGWANIQIVGDTTCGKSETQKKIIRLLKAGSLISAETASTVGLTGTATQLEKEGWFIDWGFLPLMDRKLLAIDGAHKLSAACWAALAEAERSGVLSIVKAAKNSTYARTRQIKISNAVDREDDKYSTKSLSSFLYACQALSTILDKTSIARLDLCVFVDQRDVAPEIINQSNSKEYDKDIEALQEVLKWVWRNKAQVEWTENAEKVLLEKATELHRTFFCESIPLITIDVKWKLARLSVALAYLTLSTDETYSKVFVTEEHIFTISNFLSEEYSKAGLNILAQEGFFEKLTLEDVKKCYSKIQEQLGEPLNNLSQILKFVVIQGRTTRDELKTKFSLSEKSQLRPLVAILQTEGLLKSSRGYYPTPKIIEAYKISNGFATLATFATSGKEGGGSEGDDIQEKRTINDKTKQTILGVGESFSDSGKDGNSGKELRCCGNCKKFHRTEPPSCSFPHGPKSPGLYCDYALKCRDFEFKDNQEPPNRSNDLPEPGEGMEGFD